MDQQLKLVCISDTHGRVINNLPSGDILVHCGDFTLYGEFDDAFEFLEWFRNQNFKYKIFIAGNHDNPFYYKTKKNNNSNRQKLIDELEEKIKTLRESQCYYLENDSVTIEGYKIWGSPHSLKIWGREERPFQIQSVESENLWDKLIPNDADIVITHGPPFGHGDQARWLCCFKKHVGDQGLLRKINQVQPIIHLFGHIHEGYGRSQNNQTQFINCSQLDKRYNLNHEPQVIYLKKK